MRIGINLTHLNPGVNGGIEHCIRAWIHHFPLVAPQHTYVLFGHEKVLKTIDDAEQYELVSVPFWLENLTALSQYLTKIIPESAIDVWWSPLMVLDPLDLSIPSAFVLADMQHEYYPQFFSEEELTWRRQQIALSAEKANLIITISHDAKKDICHFLQQPADKVIVAHLDCEQWFFGPHTTQREKEVKAKYTLPDDYLFFPANTWPHKNHINLLKAFSFLKKVYPKLHLVFTGAASNAHQDIKDYIEKNDLAEKVFYLGHIAREDMPYIYRNAKMLVFASLFEGFGIPLVEAMRSDCPIVASNVTSIPEIVGDAALYVDPKNPLDIASKVSQLLDDKSLAKGLVRKGHEVAKQFSYAKSALLIISQLEQLLTTRWHGRENAFLPSSPEQPLVSIITPSYNQGQFIEETIKSVIGQTYKNIEYIIVDGGSRDKSVSIIQKYADLYPNQIQWVSEKDRGQTDAINKGLRRAKGDIVAWLNSDDVYNLEAVEKVVDFFKKNPAVAFVHGQGHHIGKEGVFIEPYPSHACDFCSLHATCPICQPTTFWRRNVLDTIGYLNDELNFAMDYDYWIRVSKLFQLGFISEHLASTRLYDETKTLGQRHKVHKEILTVVKRHYGTVHANWIYAYAHTYPLIVHNDRKGILKNIGFAIMLSWYSAINFVRFNHRIPLSSIRLFLGWVSAAGFPNKKR